MRLEELVVENFRKLAGRHTVRPAPSGLTVISGDNEDGKSTLLEALKTAFFLKHNAGGEARDAIQPLAGDAVPMVAVAFRLGADAYRLEKRFKRNGVRLETPDGVLEGDAAELALARLLAFEWPGRGPARSEHMGLSGLFWVDQGTTFAEPPKPSGLAREQLDPLLAAEVASIAVGERVPRLLHRVRLRTASFWHASQGGKAKGELLALEQAVRAAEDELAEATAAEQEIETRLDALALAIERRREWHGLDRIGQARTELEAARSRLARVKALIEEHRLAKARQEATQAELARLCQLRDGRERDASELATLASEREKLAVERERLEADLAVAESQRRSSEYELSAAHAALDTIEARARRLARQRERLLLQRDLTRLERAVQAIDKAEADRRQQAAKVAAEPLTANGLAELEALATRIGETRRALRLVATMIEIVPERPTAAVTQDDRSIDPRRPIEVTASTRLGLEGFGDIVVTPGGRELTRMRQELDAAEAALATSLDELGAASVIDARRRLDAKQRLRAAADLATARIADLIADADVADPTELRIAEAEVRARLAGLTAEGCADETDAADEQSLDAARRALEAEQGAATADLTRLGERHATARATVDSIAQQLGQLEFADARNVADAARLAERLAAEQDELADAELTAALVKAEDAATAAASAEAALADELDRADPATAEEAAAQAERRLAQLTSDAAALDRQVHDLEAELRGLGAKGAGDRKAALEGRLELARRLHARRRAEADAWRLLHDTLEAVEREREEALAEPLRARLEPYLRMLMGDAAAFLEPRDLGLNRLARGGLVENFASLSVGTREQLAILVRLAIGDLLAETAAGSPPLVLDDALAYADAVRLARMRTILQRAARHQQIIILTCRAEDYRGLDARYLTLDACREPLATAAIS